MRQFFTGSKKTDLKPEEILLSITIPFTEQNEYIQFYRQAKRRKLDTPIISCGLQVKLTALPIQTDGVPKESGWKIESMCLAFGSMAPSTIMMSKTQECLTDKPWCRQTMKDGLKFLLGELSLNDLAPGGQPEYRSSFLSLLIRREHESYLGVH